MKKARVAMAALCFSAMSFAGATALAQGGSAQDPVSLGSFGDWTAYSFTEASGRVCFMSSQPKKQEASIKNVKRGEAFMFITHWASEKTKNVVSVSVGYPLKENSQVTLSVDGKDFKLFTQGEMAWTRDQATDDAISDALAKGSRVVVEGASWRGTRTTDSYSLKGSAQAYSAITKACGV